MLGMVYTSETRFRLDGSLNVDISGLGPSPVSSGFDAGVDLVWPRSAGIGILHALGDRQRLSADVLWYNWSHAFDRLDLRLTNATNPALGAFGPEITDSFPLNWKNSVSVWVGYEFFLTEADIPRAGYIYNSRVVPSTTLTPYIPGILDHTFSVGYGKRIGHCHFDLAYQFAFGPERHVGVSEIVGGDFNFSEIKAQAHWLFLSFTYHF